MELSFIDCNLAWKCRYPFANSLHGCCFWITQGDGDDKDGNLFVSLGLTTGVARVQPAEVFQTLCRIILAWDRKL